MKAFCIYTICIVLLFSVTTSNALLLKAFTKLWKHNNKQGKAVMPSLKESPNKMSSITNLPADKALAELDVENPKIGSSSVNELTDSTFDNVLLQTSGLKAVLFTAKWAAPCKAMSSNFVKASLPTYQLTDTKFYEIDTDSNPLSTAMFNVRSVPSVLIFEDSKVVAEIVGTVPAQVISDYLNKNFGEPFQ